jgi:hypothetical protein
VKYPYYVIQFNDKVKQVVASAQIRSGKIKHPNKLAKNQLSYEEAVRPILAKGTIEILTPEKEYVGTHGKIKVKCKIDGYEWNPTINSLRRGNSGCSRCSGHESKTFSQIEKIALDTLNITLINSEGFKPATVIVNKAYVQARCNIDGHEWPALVGRLLIGVGCPECGGTRKQSYEEVVERLEKGLGKCKGNVKVLSKKEEYTSMNGRIKVKCLTDGHEWNPIVGDILFGYGCTICGRKKHNGGFTLKNAERDKEEWIKIPYTVYVIRAYNDTESFNKIGVTHTKVSHRFSPAKMPYNYEVLKTVSVNKYKACYLEHWLHDVFAKYSYIPLIDFRGWTECFSELPDLENVLKQTLKKLDKELETNKTIPKEIIKPLDTNSNVW